MAGAREQLRIRIPYFHQMIDREKSAKDLHQWLNIIIICLQQAMLEQYIEQAIQSLLIKEISTFYNPLIEVLSP